MSGHPDWFAHLRPLLHKLPHPHSEKNHPSLNVDTKQQCEQAHSQGGDALADDLASHLSHIRSHFPTLTKQHRQQAHNESGDAQAD